MLHQIFVVLNVNELLLIKWVYVIKQIQQKRILDYQLLIELQHINLFERVTH